MSCRILHLRSAAGAAHWGRQGGQGGGRGQPGTAQRGWTGTVIALARIETTTPLAINHQGQFPVVTVSFNLAPGVSLGEAVRAIDEAKQELGLPASIEAGFQGTAKAFQASLTNKPLLILAALVTVYIILGVAL